MIAIFKSEEFHDTEVIQFINHVNSFARCNIASLFLENILLCIFAEKPEVEFV